MQNFFDTLQVLSKSEHRYIKAHALDLLRRKNEVLCIVEEYKALQHAQKLPTIKM